MDINLSMSAAPAITVNYLVVAIYEASAPTTLVASQAFAAPHTASRNITFANVNPVVHIVIIYESLTTAAAGTVRHQFIYDPSFNSVQIREDVFFRGTAGATSRTDATLMGWVFDIERRGSGTMERGVDYSYDDTTGTWALLQGGDTMADQEIFIYHFQPKITVVTPTSVAGGGFSFVDTAVINVNTTLDSTYMGKCIYIQGTPDHLTVTLPLLDDIPVNKIIPIISEGGNHINATLQTQSTDRIKWLNALNSKLFISQSEQLWLFKYGGVYNISNAEGNFKTVGEIVHTHLLLQQNTVQAAGQILSRATYPRLWAYVQTLDAAQLVSDTDWNNVALNNKGKFSTGDGATTFRIPLLYTPGFLRGVDGTTRKAGTYESDTIIDHKHEGTIGQLPSTLFGIGIARLRGEYRDQLPGPTDLSSSPVDPATGLAMTDKVGTETKPATVGIYMHIRY